MGGGDETVWGPVPPNLMGESQREADKEALQAYISTALRVCVKAPFEVQRSKGAAAAAPKRKLLR
jgi:hypothetical protein